jgi:hypothetical protein
MNIIKFSFLSILFIIALTSSANENIAPVTTNAKQEDVPEIKIGKKLYLNACSGNPKNYSLTPFIAGETIYEVPNIISKLEKGPYGRPFKVQATSSWNYQGYALKAVLNDFRDLKIIDVKSGKVLYTRKTSGASSLYEIKHNGVLFGWGVGWHKYCNKSYSYIDFTAFRGLIPVIKNDMMTIEEKVFSGLGQTKLKDALKDVKSPLLVETKTIEGSAGYNHCYYCMPTFIVCDHDKGFHEISTATTLKELNVKIEKINPMLYTSWLAYTSQSKVFNKFIYDNFFAIIKEFKESYSSFDQETKEYLEAKKMEDQWPHCQKFLNSDAEKSIDSAIANCFPAFIEKSEDHQWWQGLFFVEYRKEKAKKD